MSDNLKIYFFPFYSVFAMLRRDKQEGWISTCRKTGCVNKQYSDAGGNCAYHDLLEFIKFMFPILHFPLFNPLKLDIKTIEKVYTKLITLIVK